MRELAEQFGHFLEVNFEEQRTLLALFEGGLNSVELCENLSVVSYVPVAPGKTLFF